LCGRKFSQSGFLTNADGKLLVDYVVRFESLPEDLAHVCRVLDIPFSLKHANCSSHRDYRSYYDQRAIDLVAEHCRRDIELFGYTFDGAREGIRAPTEGALDEAEGRAPSRLRLAA
jgi:hypothetical protein